VSGLPAPGFEAEALGGRLVEISTAFVYAMQGNRLGEVLDLEREAITALHRMGDLLREAAAEEARWARVRGAAVEPPGPMPMPTTHLTAEQLAELERRLGPPTEL
jgi:hypothetical protein